MLRLLEKGGSSGSPKDQAEELCCQTGLTCSYAVVTDEVFMVEVNRYPSPPPYFLGIMDSKMPKVGGL